MGHKTNEKRYAPKPAKPVKRRRKKGNMEEQIWAALEKMQGNIAAEIRVMLGEAALAQSLFDDAGRQRRIEAMKKCAAKSTSDIERHDSWIKMHVESGWVYGEQFDPAKKTHPNILPWSQLPATVKSKARIFDIVSKTALELQDALIAAR